MMIRSKLKIWISSARPKTLPAAVGPVLIGSAMAYTNSFNIGVLLATLLAALLIQIGTNFANDYYDFVKGADTTDRVGPVRATQAGLVTPAQMRRAFVITFGLAVMLGAYLVWRGGVPILVIGVASVVCAVLYTAGPFPLAYVGLGEVFVVFFFGPVATGGTYYLQTLSINADIIIAGLAPGLLSTAILAVNNLRDIETDKIAGKKTLSVRFGYNFGVAEYISCIVVACLVPLYLSISSRSHYFCNLSLLTLVIAVGPIKTILSKPDPETLNNVLAQTGKLLLIYSVLFSAGWLI